MRPNIIPSVFLNEFGLVSQILHRSWEDRLSLDLQFHLLHKISGADFPAMSAAHAAATPPQSPERNEADGAYVDGIRPPKRSDSATKMPPPPPRVRLYESNSEYGDRSRLSIHKGGGTAYSAKIDYSCCSSASFQSWNHFLFAFVWTSATAYYDEIAKLGAAGKLKGKKVAVFGLGDQEGYEENFADGTGELHDVFESHGCTMFG